ncbi:MAG TPA: TatD family hydrolase [Candidatus Omnitrophota bacterium]|nr:TatD family hydrolase [Candidatus Omnitrophota bacterium]HPB67387.1 TatD family hydrolase [Candidatus Omnitrophota bacterium]HQO58039.1 TatD family hydrolase [Candidatus Omnitrophota bacterium]
MIDTHAHLDHVENLPEVLAAAVRAGVTAVIAVGEDLASNQKNLHISQSVSRPRIYPGFGFHPDRVHRQDPGPCLEFIQEHIKEAVAIGEIGLDFWYPWVKKEPALKEKQKAVFLRMLQAAKETDRPAVIHSRGAWQESLDMVRDAGIQKAVFHWYSGPLDVLDLILAQGYYVSCSPSLSYSQPSQAVVRAASLDRLLIETDSPVFYRNGDDGPGFIASPQDVLITLDWVCRLKNLPKEAASEVLNQNARRFFAL